MTLISQCTQDWFTVCKLSILGWRAIVDAFRTFLASSDTSTEVSNPAKHL
jgi:hypothetical protein